MKLKILVISARYPPYHFGGYEIRCNEIIDELYRRGHQILIITSIRETYSRLPNEITNYRILRNLHIRYKNHRLILWMMSQNRNRILNLLLTFLRGFIYDLHDTGIIDQQIKKFQPDVIYTGHITCLSRAIMPYISGCNIPVVHDEGGSGLIDLREKKGIWYKFTEQYISRYPFLNTLKTFVIKFICRASANRIKPHWTWPSNMQIIFNSEANYKNATMKGIPTSGAKVIHSGIDLEKFVFLLRTRFNSPLSIIVPGRIEPRKGQIDAARLLAKLLEFGINGNLVIVGESWSNSYCLELENEIKVLHLEEKVSIMPMVGQNQLIKLYQQADICFFPSYQETGFSRTPLEAMACGCIVFSYGNEGSSEIIRNKQTGFLVLPGEYQEITILIKELITDPSIVKDMVNNARKEIEGSYSMDKYIDKIEEIIVDAANMKQ